MGLGRHLASVRVVSPGARAIGKEWRDTGLRMVRKLEFLASGPGETAGQLCSGLTSLIVDGQEEPS